MRHIVWLRNELRLEDNPALYNAALHDSEVLPVFVWPGEAGGIGGASRWWLHQSLRALSAALHKLGARLHIRTGAADRILPDLAKHYKADAVFWSRSYDPAGRALEDAVKEALRQEGTDCRIFAGANHLVNPADVWNKSGAPFKVFTPFYKQARTITVDEPFPAPNRLASPKSIPGSGTVDGLGLEPVPDWAGGLREAWHPGEPDALSRLGVFIEEGLQGYGVERDFPGQEGTSRLSPHLHFGEISPRTAYHKICSHTASSKDKSLPKESEVFLRQLYWREFAHHLLHHFPHMSEQPMYPHFKSFPWRKDAAQLRAWQRGNTGFPIVDAGMRELWATGWMHNRVRMIAGSFLVKDLLLSWQSGAAWFWDTLVDADAANNTLGWQWVGGCGPDAAPYFRIFNPMLQSKRFDPDGLYIKKWVPELGRLTGEALHAPWTASPHQLKEACITLGSTYPNPIVDHAAARDRALLAYQVVKAAK